MEEITWTPKELADFEYFCGMDDTERLNGGNRAFDAFIAEHGKEKCDAMWAELNKQK